jgi:CubicO group peptidase (beta-lactamase class C family)
MQIYSNSNFWLLGLIVEKASGMTYEDYVEKKIFEPLGMSRSSNHAHLKAFRGSPALRLRASE